MRALSISALTLSLVLFQTQTASAEEAHTHLGAHVHGAGELMAALEGSDLLIELRLPGMDTVGFEHAPQTPEQHKAADEAIDKLKAAESLFRLPNAAKCVLEDAHVTSPFHDDDGHEHEKEAAHEHEDEHEGETHSEFMAEYHFRCEAPQNFDSLNVKVFSVFSTLEDIDYQVVAPNGQLGGELSPGNTKIEF